MIHESTGTVRGAHSTRARTAWVALLGVLAVISLAPSSAAAGRFERNVETTSSAPTLVVRLERGSITVDTHPGTMIRIEAEARGFGAENIRFHLEQRGSEWALGAEAADWLEHLAVPPRVEVRAWVPAGTALELETGDGGVLARRITSGLRARTTGDVIRVEAAGGPVDLASSGGPVVANFASAPYGRVDSEGGAMDLRFPVGARLDVDAASAGGRVVVDGGAAIVPPSPGKATPAPRRDRARGTVNGGGDVLQLRGAGGDIHLHLN